MNFDEYWKQLWIIKRDYDVEQYYDEILRPLFREAIENIDSVKVIPTFDTRTHNSSKRKTQYGCVANVNGNFVWPDYVFVPENYCNEKPVPPYLNVEFKRPNIVKTSEGQLRYEKFGLKKVIEKNRSEIEGELRKCPLILTDGITWFFLGREFNLEKPESSGGQQTICLVNRVEDCDENSSDVLYSVELCPNTNERFRKLKDVICEFVNENRRRE